MDSTKFWMDVRDAAEFPVGDSPMPLPFDGIKIEYSTDRVRMMGTFTRQSRGDKFTTEQARAFLLLHGQELQDRMDRTVKDFLKEKL